MTAADDDFPLQPAEPAYRHVLRAQLALNVVPLVIGAIVADLSLLRETAFAGLASLVAVGAGTLAVVLLPPRRYRHLRHRLTDRMLQSIRGWMFHTDTIVPFVRVQHLDVVRGPLDKMLGTATLVVHTAGTNNSVVTVNGLAPERAEQMRDVIRAHARPEQE